VIDLRTVLPEELALVPRLVARALAE